MWDLIDEELGKKSGAQKGATIKKYSEELIALKRTSTPEDVAKLVAFLAGPDSDYGEYYPQSWPFGWCRSRLSEIEWVVLFCADNVIPVTGQTQLVDGGIIFT